jgi:hypothetical protein
MSKNLFSRLLGLALLAMAMLLLSACAATSSSGQAGQEISFEPWDGDGLDIPLDGSSLTAWDSSLARVKAHTTPEQYRTLESSLDYLLFYDFELKGDREKFAAKMDGLTAAEAIDAAKTKITNPEGKMGGSKRPPPPSADT